MMVFSDRLVHEYQKEYKRKFGGDISFKDAERQLLNLKDLVRLIVKVRRQHNGS